MSVFVFSNCFIAVALLLMQTSDFVWHGTVTVKERLSTELLISFKVDLLIWRLSRTIPDTDHHW